MAEKLRKENDYTLSVTQDLPSGGTLSRFFNFASEQVTTIYERKAEKEHSIGEYSAGKATAVSVSLASQMQVQNFSDLDSQAEVAILRDKLVELGGTPPEAANNKQKIAPAKLNA